VGATLVVPGICGSLFRTATTPGMPPGAGRRRRRSAGEHEFFGADYELDIGGCVTRAWDLMKNHFWDGVPAFWRRRR